MKHAKLKRQARQEFEMTPARIDAALEEAVQRGHVEHVAMDDGAPGYRITESGKRYIEEKMLARGVDLKSLDRRGWQRLFERFRRNDL